MSVGVLFVCLGNICRSPTAQGVFERLVTQAGLQDRIRVDSAGTGGWHAGEAPDARAQFHAEKRGYALGHLRARQFTREDFDRFDFILAMDRSNLEDLQRLRPRGHAGELALLLRYARNAGRRQDVPDPYYQGTSGFETVLDLVEDAAGGLLEHLQRTRL